MAIRAGRFRGTLTDPKMSLAFLCIRARPQYVNIGGTSNKQVWTVDKRPIRCNAAPISDDLLMLQPATENRSTIIFHFYANQDVKVHDRVQLMHIDAVVGDPGSWFELQTVERPHDLITYTRAHARVIDPPTVPQYKLAQTAARAMLVATGTVH